ncbi:MAG: CHAT domain-containing protein [Acidobacteriota bacterium]
MARVARILVNADGEEAVKAVRDEFGFDSAAATDLLPALRLLGFFAVAPFEPMSACASQSTTELMGFMQQAMTGLPVETWLVLWPILGWDEALLPALEEKVLPDRVPPLRRLRDGVETYLAASTHREGFALAHKAQGLWDLISGKAPGLSSAQPVTPPEEDNIQGNEQSSSDSNADGSPSAATTDALSEGLTALSAGRLEDAVRWLQRAQADPATKDDLHERIQFGLARPLLTLAYSELGQDDPAQHSQPESGGSRDALDRLLDLIGKAVLDQDGVGPQAVLTAVMEHAGSGPEGAAEIAALWELGSAMIPGLSALASADSGPASEETTKVISDPVTEDSAVLPISSPLGGDFVRLTIDVGASLVANDHATAVQQAFEVLDRYPRYENLGLLFKVVHEQWRSGRREPALANALKGLDRMEAILAAMEVEELRRSFIHGKASALYQLAFAMAAHLGEVERAFEVVERGRAWDLRSRWGSLGTQDRIGPSAEEREALAQLSAFEARIDSAKAATRSAWLAKRFELRENFRYLRLKRALLRGADAQKKAGARSLPSLARVKELLMPSWSMVIYASDSNAVWALVIDHETGSSLHPLPLPTETLQRTLNPHKLRKAARSTRASGRRAIPVGQAEPADRRIGLDELYEMLIAPFRSKLTGDGLLIVPYGSMTQIPFGALRDEDSFLIEDYLLAQIPTVAVLEHWQERSSCPLSACKVEIFGPPTDLESPLPGAQREAQEVGKLFDTAARMGPRSAEADLYVSSSEIGLLHIATHGEFSSASPLFSRLHLAAGQGEDGLLDFHEIWDRLDLREAQLVTLSGCETGLGESTRGDDVLGMTTAFLAAGSRSVISTLWQIPDLSSSDLMISFYEKWRRGMTVSAALQKAQLEQLRSEDQGHEWAAYVLTGNPLVQWN